MCLINEFMYDKPEMFAYKMVGINKDGIYSSIYLSSKPTAFSRMHEFKEVSPYYDEARCFHAYSNLRILKGRLHRIKLAPEDYPLRVRSSNLVIVQVRLFGFIYCSGCDLEVAATGIEFLEEIDL